MKVITSHLNADFDSLASMVAAKKLYPDAVLVFPGSQEKSLRDFLIHSTLYLFDIAKVKDINPEDVDTLILVDTRQRERIGDLAKVVDRKGAEIIIYDHHPVSLDDIAGNTEVIRTVGATVTILIGLIQERHIDITPEEATIMMLGIYEETGSFQFASTTPEDFLAAAFLLSQGANVNIVSDMLVKELTPEQISLLNDMIGSVMTYNINGIDIVTTEVSTETYMGDLAVLVHKFRDIENINVIFALFRMEDRVYIIGRSRIPEVDTGHILSLMGGGGHKEAASCTAKGMTLIEAKEQLLDLMKYNVKPLRKAKDIMFFPVKSISADSPLSDATSLMVKYNINTVPVTSKGNVVGILTRQIGEKAAFHHLETVLVKEFMVSDFKTIKADDSLEVVKEIIIGDNQRFLPVLSNGRLIGAITRTDLLRVLQDEIAKSIHEKLEFQETYQKRKNVRSLMEERLDEATHKKLTDIGILADTMGYHAHLVGGFVRDLLLRIENFDVDIVIEGDGIKFAEELSKAYGVKVRPHREFATAKVTYPDRFRLDIATARLEYYKAPAALPTVEHGSLKLDLHRRDFTINTLAISLNKNTFGELIDFFGAQRDIKDKIIRVIHSLSFVEDPTRVFRAIRFEYRFGFTIGKHTMNLIKNAAKLNILARIKGKRLWQELTLILFEDEPEKILRRLQDMDLLKYLSPFIVFNKDKERLFVQMRNVIKWYDLLYRGKPCDRILFFTLGLIDNMKEEDVIEFAKNMEVSENITYKTIDNYRKYREIIFKLLSSSFNMKKSEIYRLFEPLSQEARLFIMSKTKSEDIKKAISNYITYSDTFKPFIGGKDLKKLGIPEGPIFKEILDAVKEARIDTGIKTKEDEIAFVKEYLQKREG